MNHPQLAFIFPGQGSQFVGMAHDVAQAYPVAKQVFLEADDVLSEPLSELIFNGPAESLNDTYNTQVALYVVSIALLRALGERHPQLQPSFVAGHSLGELSALTAAGVLPFQDGVWLVRERGRLMKQAGTMHPGGMAAVLGLEADEIRRACDQASRRIGRPVVLANDNCPGQIVISGDVDALAVAGRLAQDAGARRVIPLAVSIAPHSPLMAPAFAPFKAALDAIDFQVPVVPVYGNISAAPLADVASIRRELEHQLTSPVRWRQSVQAMINGGARVFLELGARDVLTGLMKRIDREVLARPVGTLVELENLSIADIG
jgi:[acyl-carrier-protein] S-malonyltransferase